MIFCSPTGIGARTNPRIAIGFVRFTRWRVAEFSCRQNVTSSRPGPSTCAAGDSFSAHATAFRSSRPWSFARISQYVRSRSNGK